MMMLAHIRVDTPGRRSRRSAIGRCRIITTTTATVEVRVSTTSSSLIRRLKFPIALLVAAVLFYRH